MTFDGQRFRSVRNRDTGSLRYEATPEYEAWLAEQASRAARQAADLETVVDRWMVGGMVGRIVRRKDGTLAVDTSDPAANGELVVFEEGE